MDWRRDLLDLNFYVVLQTYHTRLYKNQQGIFYQSDIGSRFGLIWWSPA